MHNQNISKKLIDFVNKGGILLGTYITGYVNENCLCYQGGFPGDGLSDLFGIICEEIDTLYPLDTNAIKFDDKSISSENWIVKDYAELLRIKDAEVLGKYTEDFYKDMPALTCKNFGKGKAYYQAARCEPDNMTNFFKKILSEAQIQTKDLPDGIEYHKRQSDSESFEFYFNTSEQNILLEKLEGTDLISQKPVDKKIYLEPKGCLILKK